MPLSSWFAAAAYRLSPRVTHDAGHELAHQAATGSADALRRRRHCTVVSFRKDGSPAATPVWFAVDADDRIVFRSLSGAAKVRRIQRRPDVLVAPCGPRGRPAGPPLRGHAELLTGDAADRAEALLRRKYSFGRRAYKRAIAGAPATYVAIRPL